MVNIEQVAGFFGNTTQTIWTKSNEFACDGTYENTFYYFLLPLLLFIICLVLIRYKTEIKLKFMTFFSKRGYIKILFIKQNKKMKEKLVKLDTYNNFSFEKRKYNLDKMYDFIVGYDKYNFPIFMYDVNFIIPLKMEKKEIDEMIRNQLLEIGVSEEDIKETISQIILKIDSSVLQTVYDKKLLSDLYSITSADVDFKKKMIYIIGGLIILAFLYYTGYLDKILAYLGFN